MSVDFEKYMKQLNDAGAGRKSVAIPKTICPVFYGETCSMCNKVNRYLKGIDNTKEWSAARAKLKSDGFVPSDRYYFNCLLMDDPDKVILFEAPPTIGEGLAQLQTGANKDFAGFMHPSLGRNIYIEKTGGGRYCEYKVVPRAQVTKLPNISILKRLYQLDDIVDLLEDRNINHMRASQLENDSTTEIRVLPNWTFTECMQDAEKKKKWMEFGYSLFLTTIPWHFNIGPDEFAGFERGELRLPFEQTEFVISGEEDIPYDLPETPGKIEPVKEDIPYELDETPKERPVGAADPSTALEELPETETEQKEEAEEDLGSYCIGEWEDGSFICQECDKEKECKKVTQQG